MYSSQNIQPPSTDVQQYVRTEGKYIDDNFLNVQTTCADKNIFTKWRTGYEQNMHVFCDQDKLSARQTMPMKGIPSTRHSIIYG